MKSTIVTGDGQVRCPECGAVNSFTSKRTGKAKWAAGVTLGVGALAMPKRLKCNGCGTNLKRGEPPAPARPNSAATSYVPDGGSCAISFCKVPAADGSSFCPTHRAKVSG